MHVFKFPILADRFMTDNIGVMREIQAELGDLFKLQAPGKTMVVAFKPEDVCTIYKNDGKMPYQPGFEPLEFYRSQRPDLYRGNGTPFDYIFVFTLNVFFSV